MVGGQCFSESSRIGVSIEIVLDPGGKYERVKPIHSLQLFEGYWFFLPVFEGIRNMAKWYWPGFKDRAAGMVADRLGDDPSVRQWQVI